ncbi:MULTISPECIES: M1 family metallopeptidase [Sphingobacterium]|uniref:M1 family metallopeptidase n=1 Tax=Sphingobacterium TaxID=28453 RepID=UPI00097F05F4|nr:MULTISPECIES: M1 family metallopeptidase [Sphingobacterium]UXD68892.1 M1 family metallopeptidase [Sphingobacterium faecium]WGQ16605.1 M1 family metallopeptidase [Sphingobacterium faecium]SJN20734.1 Zn-dependent aminopeptidase [Sphingobacterium faecium PCAi_F2.5]HCU45133.1 M1 family peptidase [Sphingobacterium sp.]
MNLKYLYTLILGLFLIQTTTAQRKGYWQQAVDYKMNIDVNEKTYQYDGNMQLKYSNNSGQSLKKVYFHLYFNAFQPGSMMDNRLSNIADPDKRMATNIGTKEKPKYQSRIATLTPKQIGYQKIKSLTINGNNTSYKVDGTILEVTLPNEIEDGETATFDMTWEAQVPEQIRRSGRNSKEGVALSMAQWYPKMAHFDEFGWHLDEYIGREFIAPFGNFDVTVNINKNYILGASGVLQNPTEVKGYAAKPKIRAKDNKVQWHYIAKNIHDFVWAADPKFVVDSASSKQGIHVYTVYIPESDSVKTNWKTALGLATEFFDFNAKTFGAYPWPTYTIIQGGDGGMEYGTATLVTGGRNLKSLVGVIFHEAAHSWYQHLFGINETVDEWFDEGFTSYVEELAMQNLFEKRGAIEANPSIDAYRAYYKLALSGKEEPASLLADYYNTNYAYSNEAYNKGQVLAVQLGYIIGKDNLDKTFLEFYKQWKFKHPTPNDFKRIAENISGINLKWYFNLFINTTRKIDYAIKTVSDKEITLQNKSDFAMPIDLLVTYEDGTKELFYIPLREMRGEKPAENFKIYEGIKRTTLEDWNWTQPSYQINLTKKPAKAIIDPSLRLADVESSDNTWEKK